MATFLRSVTAGTVTPPPAGDTAEVFRRKPGGDQVQPGTP